MKGRIKYQFDATIWQYSSPQGGWFFVSLPVEISKEIRDSLKWMEEGWGRLKTLAKINNTEWETAIWFDTKRQTYLLPLKAAVRKKENLKIENNIQITICI